MLHEVSHILQGRSFPHSHPNSAHRLLDTPKIELEFNYTFNLHVSTPIFLQAHYFGTRVSVTGEWSNARVPDEAINFAPISS